eukprot:3371010-Heterocapsa_arctica.AAC.1
MAARVVLPRGGSRRNPGRLSRVQYPTAVLSARSEEASGLARSLRFFVVTLKPSSPTLSVVDLLSEAMSTAT